MRKSRIGRKATTTGELLRRYLEIEEGAAEDFEGELAAIDREIDDRKTRDVIKSRGRLD